MLHTKYRWISWFIYPICLFYVTTDIPWYRWEFFELHYNDFCSFLNRIGWPGSYRKYMLQITRPSSYGYAKLQYRFAVTTGSPSSKIPRLSVRILYWNSTNARSGYWLVQIGEINVNNNIMVFLPSKLCDTWNLSYCLSF